METKDLLSLMWRGVRFLIAGFILGAALGWVVSKYQSPVYEATTEVLVSRARFQSSTDMLPLSDDQLASTNIQLAKSQPVLNAVSSKLGIKINADNIQVGVIPNTLVLQIKVQDEDSKRAADIANTLVEILIQQNENLLTGRFLDFQNTLDAQINQVQNQINDLQNQITQINEASISDQLSQVNWEIDQLKSEISSLEQDVSSYPPNLTETQRISVGEKQAQLDQLRSLLNIYQQIQTNLTFIGKPGSTGLSRDDPRLTSLQSTLNLYQELYLSLVNNRETVNLARMQNTPNLAQINPAIPPKTPVRPLPLLYTLLGGIVGLAISAASILVLDNFDDTLKKVGQIEEVLGLPVLGTVSDGNYSGKGLTSLHDPLSPEAEAFRALAVSIELLSAEKNIYTLLLTNTDAGEGKSIIAANLAALFSQQGKRVILVDGDLRHPHLHKLFEINNQKGVVDVLKDSIDIKSVSNFVEGFEWMTLIPSGQESKETAGWIDAGELTDLLLKLQEQADLVIVDGPSAEVADAQMLASKVDAILLIIQAGHTRIDPAKAAVRRFQFAGARVVGAVLNHSVRSRIISKNILPWAKFMPRRRGEVSYEERSEANKASATVP